jgi:hypothetical protein
MGLKLIDAGVSLKEADRITKAAQRKGMLSNYNRQKLDRSNVALAIQDRVERHLGIIIRICLRYVSTRRK